tara:strand:- start:685 stop:1446 length:762 start_codon:yes stop_codon:yes gene_type:complete
MFFSKKFLKYTNLKHCFFSKKGGVSKGIYKSLNCGYGSKDAKSNVRKNLKIISNKIGCNYKNIITMKQVHGNKVIYINKNFKINKKLICDGILTNKKKIALGVLTADCIPILIYDRKKKIIGAIHAGWKSAFKDIIKKTLKKLSHFKSKKKDLIVSIGPCISEKSYMVNIDLYKKFINKNKNNKIYFKKTKNNKFLFNLRKFVSFQFRKNNVKNIEHINRDTFGEEKNFYSYRRSLFKKELDYGRNISIIMIN